MRAEKRHTSYFCATAALLATQALCGCRDGAQELTVTGPAGARVTLSGDSRQSNREVLRHVSLTFAPLDRTAPPTSAGRAVSATYALTYRGPSRPKAVHAPLDVSIPYDSEQLRSAAAVVLLRNELPTAAGWVPDPLATVHKGFVTTRVTRPSLFLVVTPTP
jgi:hypothetical protein